MRKYIIVTGGVISGLGKGVLAASIGKLLSSDCKCAAVKCDGYLNIDPGTMNPVEHGEVFVLDDGTECDMDFGHYERFIQTSSKGNWNLTMGKIFKSILDKERHGEYLGKTVQFVPHVTDEIKSRIKKVGEQENADVLFIEIGGTVGDLENALYLEAVRQLAHDVGRENVAFIHLSYVPVPTGVNEQKSKPTQMSVKLLNEIGIWPDIIVCRCEEYLDEKIKNKIALFCNVDNDCVFTGKDVESIYLIPQELEKQNFVEVLERKLNLKISKNTLEPWNILARRMVEKDSKKKIKIGICGKYTALGDSYASVVEAIKHAAANFDVHAEIKFLDSELIETEQSVADAIDGFDGIIIPGGFGNRGWEGKIEVIKYLRENKIPFLGICLGLQAAVVEYARDVCGLADSNSTEMNPNTENKIITLMDAQKNVVDMGGTMRLGSCKALIKENSKVYSLYNSSEVFERHRHRYEVNPAYHQILQEKGLVISGLSPDNRLVEFIELENHPFFVATQAHPEFKSSLLTPAPLFSGFVKACIK
ncbi:MAG: CTP synthase (glutamine hydrolyzing) [archaeon]